MQLMNDSFPDRLRLCETRWYVVNTKPNHEKQAEQNIARMGIECFLPMLQEEKIIRRQRKAVIAPLFPGYLFAQINLSEHYRGVIYARGVRKIVEFGSRPIQVDSAVIEAIKSRMVDSNVHILENQKQLRNGQLVQIKEGPLVGLEAVFIREMPGQQRAIVLLRTLTLQARAVVEIDQLAPYVAA
jgi:transcriptional antiterminator RfaH